MTTAKMLRKRNLQMEAKAHIAVQKWIDGGGLSGGRAVTEKGIREIHRRFCEALPKDLLWAEDPDTNQRVRVVPGELRKGDVRVGNHIAVSPGAVPRFLERFEQVYGSARKMESILSTAAAHHRLLWIHPFMDGNGRVARLMSHAMMLETLETGGVWSVARGLARNVQQYKNLLANCDQTRRNDLDGRGTLSEEALAEFTRFFLTACIDQVDFMESLTQPDRLRERDSALGERGDPAGAFARQIREPVGSDPLSRRDRARRNACYSGYRRSASSPDCFGTLGKRRVELDEANGAAAPGLSGGFGVALDARAFPG